MSRPWVGDNIYPNEDTIAAANTAQLLAKGTETHTFAVAVTHLMVTYASGAVYLAKDSTNIAGAAGGTADDRVYIAADTRGVILPWSGEDVYVVNAVAGETPTVAVVGIV